MSSRDPPLWFEVVMVLAIVAIATGPTACVYFILH